MASEGDIVGHERMAVASGHFIHERLRAGRWVPPWLRYQSQGRYDWAASFVAGRRVLEIGCGGGQGARRFLEAGAASVDACDASADSIEAARAAGEGAELRFQVATADRLPYDDEIFDLAISLETIEHIENDRAFVAEAARVLCPGGQFLCTTPNRAVTNPGVTIAERPFNPAHVREYQPHELRQLLATSFGQVEMWGQMAWSGRYTALLAALGRRWPRGAVRLHQLGKLLGMWADTPTRHAPRELVGGTQPEVLVAICTKSAR